MQRSQKVNDPKAWKQLIYALELFGTLVTPISEYGIELGALKVSKSWEKQTYIFTNLSQAPNNRQQTILFV